MITQDVADTGPVTTGDSGLHLFQVAPLTGNTILPQLTQAKDVVEKDLLFFMTRSYQTLIYSDGGD